MDRTTFAQLAAAIGLNRDARDGSFTGVGIDSRTIQPGELFWALPGAGRHGVEFIQEARRRGAVGCVTDRQPQEPTDFPTFVVRDARRSLADFASSHRQRRDALVVGVTGSVGKTTTKELIHTVLQTTHRGLCSPRNYNNELGLPLALLNIEESHAYAVLEMGARRAGDVAELCRIAQPEVGVITAIGPAHLETFGSLAGVQQAKGELFEALPRGGFAVTAGDDELTRSLAGRARCRTILVGEQPHNTLRATHVEAAGPELRFRVAGEAYRLPLPGRHQLTGALAAVAIGLEIGLAPADVRQGLEQFGGVPGRCRVERIGAWTVIDDTYNANPLSLQAAADMLVRWPTTGRRVLVTGDMLELGSDASGWHRRTGAACASPDLDHWVAFGDFAEDMIAGARGAGMDACRLSACRNWDALTAVLDCWLAPGDVVLVKGSRGMRMERALDWLRQQAAPARACA